MLSDAEDTMNGSGVICWHTSLTSSAGTPPGLWQNLWEGFVQTGSSEDVSRGRGFPAVTAASGHHPEKRVYHRSEDAGESPQKDGQRDKGEDGNTTENTADKAYNFKAWQLDFSIETFIQ